MTPPSRGSYKGIYPQLRSIVSINMVMPLALLEKTVDKRISLLLKDGRVLEGKLTGYDEYMNMVLDETVERTASAEERRLGTVVLRGNNVVSIALI